MWFSPWRRILRGRSGDAKPSGLRAGTKFVEEDTGVEYTYDPVMKDWKKKVAPYSALVAKDGSTVWVEDTSGKTIASGESGVDDASVIQSAVNNMGLIYINDGNYIINEDINVKDNCLLLLSPNAKLELHAKLKIWSEYVGMAYAFSPPKVEGGIYEVYSDGGIELADSTWARFERFTLISGESGATLLKFTGYSSFLAQQIVDGIIHLLHDDCVGLLMTKGGGDGNVGMRANLRLRIDMRGEVTSGTLIKVESGVSFREAYADLVFFPHGSATGLYIDGRTLRTKWLLRGEASGSSKVVVIGANAEDGITIINNGICICDSAILIDNPNNKLILGRLISKKEVDVEVGTGGSYGASTYMYPAEWRMSNLRIGCVISGISPEETITVQYRGRCLDTITHIVDKSYTTDGEYWLSDADLWNLLDPNQPPVGYLEFRAKSDQASTTATVKVRIMWSI